MRDYFQHLKDGVKRRYLETLPCINLSFSNDPCLTSNEGKFVNDMTTRKIFTNQGVCLTHEHYG